MATSSRSQKFCAALVLSTFMVMLITLWGNYRAGERARSPLSTCDDVSAPTSLSQKLGMARDAAAMLALLGHDPSGKAEDRRAACQRQIFHAQVEADKYFVVGWGLLLAAMFAFVGSLRGSRRSTYLLLGLGLALAAGFAYGDFGENEELIRWIGAASQSAPANLPEPSRLQQFFTIKLATLALAAFALGIWWTSRSDSRRVLLPKSCAFLAFSSLAWAIYQRDADFAGYGLFLLFLLAFLGLCHALAVAVVPEPASVLENPSLENDQ